MRPHIMVEMTDRPNITQNIIVTMSNNEIIIEICRKNALAEDGSNTLPMVGGAAIGILSVAALAALFVYLKKRSR